MIVRYYGTITRFRSTIGEVPRRDPSVLLDTFLNGRLHHDFTFIGGNRNEQWLFGSMHGLAKGSNGVYVVLYGQFLPTEEGWFEVAGWGGEYDYTADLKAIAREFTR